MADMNALNVNRYIIKALSQFPAYEGRRREADEIA